eukprot:2818199-Amphidinium_carterae.1
MQRLRVLLAKPRAARSTHMFARQSDICGPTAMLNMYGTLLSWASEQTLNIRQKHCPYSVDQSSDAKQLESVKTDPLTIIIHNLFMIKEDRGREEALRYLCDSLFSNFSLVPPSRQRTIGV